jgi:hypothetical protein
MGCRLERPWIHTDERSGAMRKRLIGETMAQNARW